MASSSSSAADPTVVSGRDLAPDAFDRSLPGCDDPDKADDLGYDLHHLVACDAQPRDGPALARMSVALRNQALHKSARDNAQLLFNRIFQLDTVDSNDGLLAVLPDADPRDPGCVERLLPRHRPVPVPKPETRWEKFAKEKGIKGRKRDRMVLDERTGEYKPRWGYGRANDDTNDWAIPVGPHDDPFADPFEARKIAKKERVLKNNLKQMANMDRAAGIRTSHGMKANLVGRSMKGGGGGLGKGKKRSKHGLGADTGVALVDTQRSDASMGKFAKLNSGEKKADRGGRRRKRSAVTPNDSSERDMTLAVMNKLLGKTVGAAGRIETRNDSGMSKGAGGKKGKKKKKKGGRTQKKQRR